MTLGPHWTTVIRSRLRRWSLATLWVFLYFSNISSQHCGCCAGNLSTNPRMWSPDGRISWQRWLADRDVRFGLQMGQIWDFWRSFFGEPICTEKLYSKAPDLSHLVPIWPTLGPNPIRHPWSCSPWNICMSGQIDDLFKASGAVIVDVHICF